MRHLITLPLFLYSLFILRKVVPAEKSGITESPVFQTAI